MYVFVKQSGELLNKGGKSGDAWTPDGIRASVDKLVAAYSMRVELGMTGLTLVSGAGNFTRGDTLREEHIGGEFADVLGRLSTIKNTIVLADALRRRDVPVEMFIAQGMEFADPTLGRLVPYTDELALQAHADGRMVAIAGGTGEDGVTTDNAVMTYAQRIKASIGPDERIQVIKGTKFDGVFDSDPAGNASARRYTEISAQYMIRRYEQFRVVDMGSLEQIALSGISMRVHRDDEHDLVTALSNHSVGTLIVSDPSDTYEPKLAA